MNTCWKAMATAVLLATYFSGWPTWAADVPPSPSAAGGGAWVKVTLLEPANQAWQVQVNVLPASGKPSDLYAGQESATQPAQVKLLDGGHSTPWLELGLVPGKGVTSVRFVFSGAKEPFQGVKARFDVSTQAGDTGLVRSITEADTGSVISLRIPADLGKDSRLLLSIRQDTQRRLDEIKALKLPQGPLPQKLWYMTGFRSNGQFYSDPTIAQMDFDIIKLLGMNAYWEQNGGQPGALRTMAKDRDINRTTVYWRSVASLPQDKDGKVSLDYNALGKFIDDVYKRSIESTRKAHPQGLPPTVVDLMDEPNGHVFDGPEYQQAFHEYCRKHQLEPEFFGQKSWDDVQAPSLGWWQYFKMRAERNFNEVHQRRLWYWACKHWNHATARLYAMASRKVEELASDVSVGTRVNFGPPWLYDYGTLPRGIDAFEFGQLQSVTLGFNEDWIGLGSPRQPLEINTLLMDWSRAAAWPRQPLLGSYITRDADRPSVKLRVWGCLARNAKIFDFYYYGPAYTHFDHWSDNFSMVRGVGELTRDLGPVDAILWDARPPQARVALLYSQSWPVWKQDDTEQIEQMMVYLALLHGGIPVDIVSDEQAAQGRLEKGGYKALYVVNESIPAAALAAVEKWVNQGGSLWASGWAGMKDEYNTPTEAWNKMLGVKDRSWKVVGDVKRLDEVIRPDDWQRPSFARQALLPGAESQPATTKALTTRAFGQGHVTIAPWTAGREYMQSAKEHKGTLAKAVLYPAGPVRAAITGVAEGAGVKPDADTSANQVLAWPLWTADKGVVLLANFTGEAADKVEVTFACPLPVKMVRSLRQGALTFTAGAGRVKTTLPINEVTDILIVE